MPSWAILSSISGTLRSSYPINPPSAILSPSHRLLVSSPSSPLSSTSDLSVRRNRHREPLVRFSAGEHGRNPSLSYEEQAKDTQDAIVEFLQEYGASEEDSMKIVLNSPKYVDMLVKNVRELDEHSLWSSWDSELKAEENNLGGLSFRKKVYYMAKNKGDGGILALLESVGLKHSSTMLIARYISSERLPDLIDKVKFLKEMFFPRCDLKVFVGRNARRMMMHLSIYIDEDIQRTLSFFEKIEAGHGRLNMLGNEDTSFPFLIESFPQLLLCSIDDHLQPWVDFIELIGVPKGSIGIILLLFPPIIFYDIEKDIKPRLHALEKAGVEEKDVGRMLLKYPWILSKSIQENYENILAFFSQEKVPKSSIDLAIRSWPHLLGCSTKKMNSIMEQFDALDVKRKMLVPVITSSPQLLLKKPNEFLEVISFMEEFGFDKKTTGEILCRCPEIFAASIENTLMKKVEFLTDFGISRDRLPRIIKKYPELLLLDIDNTLLPRMRYLIEIGLSKKEVCSMICRFSPLLGYSIDAVFKPKIEFLVKVMMKPMKEIWEYPRFFSYSLEKKIKPRFWVLKSRNLDHCSLKDMLGKNDEEFAEAYMGIQRVLVTPYPVPSNDE